MIRDQEQYNFIMLKHKHLLYFLALLSISCTNENERDLDEMGLIPDIQESDSGVVYHLDTITSLITWIGKNENERHNGIFRIEKGFITVTSNEKSGKKSATGKKITGGKITIDMTSLDILDLKHEPGKYKRMIRHLHSPDYFNTDEYPTAEFEILSADPIVADSTEARKRVGSLTEPTHRLTGILTIKGLTKKLEFPISIEMRNLKFEASFKIDLDEHAGDLNRLNIKDPAGRSSEVHMNRVASVGFEILAFSYQP